MEVKEHQGKSLAYLTVEPDGYDPAGRYPMVVLLHGFGSHMGDLARLSTALDRKGYLYAFPNAPIGVNLGFGMQGQAWASWPESAGDDETEETVAKLSDFFKEVIDQYGVEPGEVVLGGFSQGGMMTYRIGLPEPHLFAGLVALSSKVPDPDKLVERLPASREQPIFIAHGSLDSMIPLEEGKQARQFLEAQGYAPEYREYEMGHEITQDVLADLVAWLRAVLPPRESEP